MYIFINKKRIKHKSVIKTRKYRKNKEADYKKDNTYKPNRKSKDI